MGLHPCWCKEYLEADVLESLKPEQVREGDTKGIENVQRARGFSFMLLVLLWLGVVVKERSEKSPNVEWTKEEIITGASGGHCREDTEAG